MLRITQQDVRDATDFLVPRDNLYDDTSGRSYIRIMGGAQILAKTGIN